MRTKVRARLNLFRREALPRGRNDRCGYARVYQAVPHALRDLSPLSATAVVGISECVAQRPGLIGCHAGKVALAAPVNDSKGSRGNLRSPRIERCMRGGSERRRSLRLRVNADQPSCAGARPMNACGRSPGRVERRHLARWHRIWRPADTKASTPGHRLRLVCTHDR
jgi:hypothetical protein